MAGKNVPHPCCSRAEIFAFCSCFKNCWCNCFFPQMAMDCKKWQLSTLIEWYAVSGGYPVVRGIPPFLDVFIKWTNGNSLARSGSHAAFVPLPVAKSGMCSKYLFQAIWLSSNVIGLASICSFFLSGIFGHLIVSLQFFFFGDCPACHPHVHSLCAPEDYVQDFQQNF